MMRPLRMATRPEPKTLYLVDGTAQLYRAYFAIRGLSTRAGLPTNAIHGFTSMLRKLMKEMRPEHLAVAFDTPGKVFRHERFSEYKANRPPSPDDLNVQSPYARKVCDALGVAVLEQKGFEADDLIATYTRRAREQGFHVVVVAADKDLLQLVGEGVSVFNPTKEQHLDVQGVAASFGVEPRLVTDVLGLMGDSVDNIPGVPGVGEKTALWVVETYGDLDRVIERAGRFAAAYDDRDALLQAIATIEKCGSVERQAVASAQAAAERLSRSLARLLELEREDEMRGRLAASAAALEAAELPGLDAAVGQPGRTAAKRLKTLKKELKGLDRGSSKRAWYAIAGNAEQARLSKELATLHHEVPVELEPGDLTLRDPDREQALELFRELEFQALIAELERGEAGPADLEPGGDYGTVLDRGRLREIVKRCKRAGSLAIRTEADGADPLRAGLVGIALAWEEGQGAYVPMAHGHLGAPQPIPTSVIAEELCGLLVDEAVTKVAHDLKSADHLLRRHGMSVQGWGTDPMVAAFLLRPGRAAYGLDALADEHLGLVAPEEEGPAAEVEVERMTSYAARSADLALRLSAELEAKLESAGLSELYRTIDGPLLPLLARMEAHGVLVDVTALAAMSKKMEAALDKGRAEIHRLAGTEFNVDSPKQLREVLFERLGLKSRRKTAKSKVASTDAQTLEELAAEHEIARRIIEYREVAKLKGTYVDALPRLVDPESGRVHTSFQPTGAATGRLSSINPNLQNIPARTEAGLRIRSAFVPAEGFLFLASDYSQVELRVLAHLAGDAGLKAAFAAGEDIHRFTASKVFGVAPDLVSDTMRRRAKAVNFGILYGMSEMRLAREQGMKRTEAREFIQTYFKRFASVRAYIEKVKERVADEGCVRTLFGRVRQFPQLHQKVNRAVREQALRAAVNTTIQGTAADLMKMAMLRVERALEAEAPGARILLQVHDELLLEVPQEQVEATGGIVREAMERVHELDVPLVVDQKTGRSWLEVT